MDTKVTTVIVNTTRHDLTMKVGNCSCFIKLGTVEAGGSMQLGVDRRTDQEFAMEVEARSGDFCDFERIAITDLTMKVGNRSCFIKLGTVKAGGSMQLGVDRRTDHEFAMEVEARSDKHMVMALSSDDCCDFERIAIKESGDGELDVQAKLVRQKYKTGTCASSLRAKSYKRAIGKLE